jgi:polyhydroxybutyrate depolymerase
VLKVFHTRFCTLLILLLGSCASHSAPEISSANPANAYSAGCGIKQIGSNDFKPMQLTIQNQTRTYHLRVPAGYNPDRAYPLIFLFHGYGGNGLSGGLGIEHNAQGDALIIGADGLNNQWNQSTTENDLHFFDRLLETVSSQYCVDKKRVFSYGFSMGGNFTNLLACERGDVLRATASIASWPRGDYCKGKVAAWFLHDTNDEAINITQGIAARDKAIASNGCSQKTVDVGNGCVQYQGCQDAPVVWCQTSGFGHDIRGDFAPAIVWQFFQNFR